MSNYFFNRFFGNAETGADQSFFADEFFDLNAAKTRERLTQSVETNFRAVKWSGDSGL